MTILILEGVDETGKTTLANQLVLKHGFYKPNMDWLELPSDKGKHWYDNPANRRGEWERLLVMAKLLHDLAGQRNVVLDRFYASQYAYSLTGSNYSREAAEMAGCYADKISQVLNLNSNVLTLLLKPQQFKPIDGEYKAWELRRDHELMERFLDRQNEHYRGLHYSVVTAKPKPTTVLDCIDMIFN